MSNRNYSRYASTKIINDGTKLLNGLRSPIDTTLQTDDVYYTVRENDRIDNLAYKYFGRADLWWVIADYNSLSFPLVLDLGSILRLPSNHHLLMDLLK